MNFNNYTIKSQEAIQQAQQLAQGLEHQQIENEHLFKALFDVDDNVLPFLLKKLNVNVDLLQQILEKEIELTALVNWKNLKTGELLIDNFSLSATASYSEYQQQDIKYASNLAANNLARKIVELMEVKW